MRKYYLSISIMVAVFLVLSNSIQASIITTAVSKVDSQPCKSINISKPNTEEAKTDVAKTTIENLGVFYNRKKISQLVGKSKKILLTFDDGPSPRVTPKILKILKKRNLKAIFFVIGLQVKKYPQIIKQIHDAGHIIGNHTYNHKDLTKLSKEQINKQIDETNRLIENITGEKVTYLRPPYGALNKTVISLIVKKGMSVMLWNVDPKDWQNKNRYETLHNLKSQLRIGKHGERGGVVLMHDIYNSTAQALNPFLDQLAENNYPIVSMYNFSHNRENRWVYKPPFLFKQRLKQEFELKNTTNNLLVYILNKKYDKKDLSAFAMLKAKKTGNLIEFMFRQRL